MASWHTLLFKAPESDGIEHRTTIAQDFVKMPNSIPPGRFFCDCNPGEVARDSAVLICNGSSHRLPRKHHAECEGLPDDYSGDFVCNECLALTDAQAIGSQPLPETAPDVLEGAAVLDERLAQDGEGLEYFFRNQDGEMSWQPESAVPEELVRIYEDVEDEAHVFNEEDTEFAVEASQRATNFNDEEEQGDLPNPCWKYLQRGYWSLSHFLYPAVTEHSKGKDMPDLPTFDMYLAQMMAQTPDAVLRALCGRHGLRRSRLTDSALRTVLDRFNSQSSKHPSEYVLELCDRLGRAPTKAEMATMIEWARRYCDLDDGEAAVKIDKVFHLLGPLEEQETRAGTRRQYLTLGPKDETRKKLKILLDKLEELLQALSTGDFERVPFLLRDVGYTANGLRRIDDQHKRHRSSNKLMGLFEAISIAVIGGKYRIYGDVVFLCTRYEHAPLGEIVFSLLTESYVETGKGFNGTEAGKQQASLLKYKDVTMWTNWRNQMYNESPYKENLERETVRRQRALDEIEKQQKQVEAAHEGADADELDQEEKTLVLGSEMTGLLRKQFK